MYKVQDNKIIFSIVAKLPIHQNRSRKCELAIAFRSNQYLEYYKLISASTKIPIYLNQVNYKMALQVQ
ncbi:MAG: hypothetical protein KME21_10325 [Desmonostoc vinosum HA7617-LM4]|nr:hypothetical protein [Desmonostoc vinosum HA7617-LM4]